MPYVIRDQWEMQQAGQNRPMQYGAPPGQAPGFMSPNAPVPAANLQNMQLSNTCAQQAKFIAQLQQALQQMVNENSQLKQALNQMQGAMSRGGGAVPASQQTVPMHVVRRPRGPAAAAVAAGEAVGGGMVDPTGQMTQPMQVPTMPNGRPASFIPPEDEFSEDEV
jgi:hypothetical protein